MEELIDLYVSKLNKKAATGPGPLLKMTKARLLKGDGPLLTQDEGSLLDIIQLAYFQAGKKEQKNYISAFKKVLKDFQVSWMDKNVEIDQAALVSFVLSFFESLEEKAPFIDYLRTFLDSFGSSEEKFKKSVPSPLNGAQKNIFGQIERFRLKCLKGTNNEKEALYRMWVNAPKVAREVVEKNSLILKAMAESDPSSIEAQRLFRFFEQTECLDEPERGAVLEELFMEVGFLLSKSDLAPLFAQTESLLMDFADLPEALSPGKIENKRRFLNYIGFILCKKKDDYLSLQKKFELKLKEAREEQKEKNKRPTEPNSERIQGLKNTLNSAYKKSEDAYTPRIFEATPEQKIIH